MIIYLTLKKTEAEREAARWHAEGVLSECYAHPFDVFHGNAEFYCDRCKRMHEKLWLVFRARGKQFGHFVAVELVGKDHVIDASLPTTLDALPRDALSIPEELACATWTADGASHEFSPPLKSLIKFLKYQNLVVNRPSWKALHAELRRYA